MNELVIKYEETEGSKSHVEGTFAGKQFFLNFDAKNCLVDVDGEFTDEERMQIFNDWDMQQ